MNGDDVAGLHEELEQVRVRAESAEAENAELRQAVIVATVNATTLQAEATRLVWRVVAFQREPFSPRARSELQAAVHQWQLVVEACKQAGASPAEAPTPALPNLVRKNR